MPVQGRDEFALLGRTFNQMAFQLQTRLDELQAERGRLRDVISRFGEALGATHDSDQLMRLIVETAIEATSASGGVFVGANGELVQVGYPDKGDDKIEVPLRAGTMDFGSLLLFGDDFTDEDRMTAASLAAHAVVALDNVRLHRIVERQALVDGLTGLANRRQCEESLADELARVERFGGSLAVVVADLDWFKDVNDRYGHPAGDTVLHDFATLLQETLRDVDIAGRWGGEEFLMVLPGTDLAGGARVAERIRVPWRGGSSSPRMARRSRSPRASESPRPRRTARPRSCSRPRMRPCTRPSGQARTGSRRLRTRSARPSPARVVPAVSLETGA